VQVRVEERAPHEFVVSLAGELDMATAPMLAETVADLMRRGPVGALVVDVSELRFLDSSGMRALLQARNAATEQGAEFAVRRPREPVAQVLRIAALEQALGIGEEDPTAPTAPQDFRGAV
jgi:anti-sigma B factor antagonist